MNNKIRQILEKSVKGKLYFDESMADHTTFGIGGPAECLVFPKDKADLLRLLQISTESNIPIYFIGSGSNLLVNSKGVKGIVVSLKKTFKSFRISDTLQIFTDSGVMLGSMVRQAIKYGISGLESLIGVPGTVGGALIMNAGAYGAEISKTLSVATVLTKKGEEKQLHKNQLQFSYRSSSFDPEEILISAVFDGIKGDPQQIQEAKQIASSRRKISQPLQFRSAGSIFKNPQGGISAGKLIDIAGLKGTACGAAEISKKHANFIVNNANATSDDVLELIRRVQDKIHKQNNICLDLEIKLLGFPDSITKEFSYA